MAARQTADTLLQIASGRRSIYALSKKLPAAVTASRIQELVKNSFQTAPSAFNSQPTRAVVLFGAEHDRLWEITRSKLRELVKDEEKWKGTSARMDMFQGAAGTVLFFDDMSTVKSMQENVPSYADKFPHWATQAGAMHQYLLWTTLQAEGLGANLQHYNPVIDAEVTKTWGIPETWKLDAQLVFGGRPEEEEAPKERKPFEEVVKVFGA